MLHQLAGHWDRFDTDTYARQIIAHLPNRPEVQVTASTPQHLAWLRRLGERTTSRIRGEFSADDIIRAHGSGTELVELSLARNPALSRLEFVRSFPHLRTLHLRECPVTDLAPLAALPLEFLYLWDVQSLARLEGIGALTGLRRLCLRESTPWPGVSHIAHLSELTTLLLPEDAETFTGISRLRGLKSLNVVMTAHPLPPEDWSELAELPEFEELTCEPHHLDNISWGRTPLPHVTQMQVLGNVPFELGVLPECFPSLRTLQLTQARASLDLAPLAELSQLDEVTLVRPESPAIAHRLPSHIEVSILPLPRRG